MALDLGREALLAIVFPAAYKIVFEKLSIRFAENVHKKTKSRDFFKGI